MKRWPLYAAIAYVVLLVVALSVVPAAPQADDSGATIVRYYTEHADAVRLSVWLGTFAAIPLVLLIAALRSRLTGIARDVMLIGAIATIVQQTIWTWLSAGLALHPSNLDPRTARTIADVGAYFGPMLTVSIILFVGPIGLAAARGAGFPRWLAWLTGAFVLEQAIETVTIFGHRGFAAPDGPWNLVLGAGLYFIWLIAAGSTVTLGSDA